MIRVLGSEFVNFYLLEEDGQLTLIDAGLPAYLPLLERALHEDGRSLDDVKAVVLTHADPDHVGFAGALQADRGIPVYVHRDDSERARSGKTKRTEGSPLAMLGGIRHAHARRILRHMIGAGGAKQAPIAEVQPFDDGDELDVPGRLRAVHTPGHTEGHAVLLAPAEEALFVGDALNNMSVVTGEPGVRLPLRYMNTSSARARESLSRIADLDAGTVYFGHGEASTTPPRQLVDEALARD